MVQRDGLAMNRIICPRLSASLRMLLLSAVVSPELLVKCVHRSIKTSGAPLIVRSLYSEMSHLKLVNGGIALTGPLSCNGILH